MSIVFILRSGLYMYHIFILNHRLRIRYNSFHSFFDNAKTRPPAEKRISQCLPTLFAERPVHCARNVYLLRRLIHTTTHKFCSKN